ncbi:MAG TPA: hypothetical protein ENH19_00360, partial [Actinobacteria bacterium]|nr:hypothetical protein [Actinomycetes bacterium]HEX21089.1 hypothetical protein [Actinomycetota bacterium]
MRKISRLKQLTIFISTIIIILLVPVTALAQSANETSTVPPTKLSLLKVSFWPEYDRQSVLGIYKGELKNSASVPATVKILIPKGAKVSSTAAIDPDGKFQYDRAWATHKVTPGTDYDILTYETIYPRFQTELYYQQLGTDKQRNLNLTFKTSMVSDNLQVEIQKPLRATDFKITPSTSNTADNEG